MKKQRFWALPWLCLCLNFLVCGCRSLQYTGTKRPVYQVQVTLAPVNHEELAAFVSANPIWVSDLKNSVMTSQTLTLTIHGDEALRAFKRNMESSGLPVMAVKVKLE